MNNNFYEVEPIKNPVDIVVEVPGSKSITNRALLIAAMAEGESVLTNVLFSSDSRFCLKSIENLGYTVDINEDEKVVNINGGVPKTNSKVNVGSAGTTARFLTALLAAREGEFYIDASEQMKARPMKPLLDTLVELGSTIEYVEKEGHLPVKLKSGDLEGGDVIIKVESSSQFLSGLLMSGCYYKNGLNIQIEGKEARKSYVGITLKMMEDFGVNVAIPNGHQYIVKPNQAYQAMEYAIEPDLSSACYFYAMAAITGGKAIVKGVHYSSIQGDIAFLGALEKLGCTVEETEDGLLLTGPKDGVYEGIDIDMNSFSDQTMTLASVAVFATSPTRIRNVAHIRLQESNRIKAIVTELTRLGIKCDEQEDGIIIYPGAPKPATIETYEDHRMAMAFSLIGLKTEGIKIDNPSCCSKTFEKYFEVLGGIISNN